MRFTPYFTTDQQRATIKKANTIITPFSLFLALAFFFSHSHFVYSPREKELPVETQNDQLTSVGRGTTTGSPEIRNGFHSPLARLACPLPAMATLRRL